MKKLFLIVVVFMAALSASAQEMYIGGGIGLWRDTDNDKMEFSISPDFGYEMSEKWAVGGELVYAHNTFNLIEGNAFAIAPYARFTYFHNKVVRLFLDMGLGLSVTKPEHVDSTVGFEIGIKPGLAVKLNDHFSLVTKVGFAGYTKDYLELNEEGFGVKLNGNNISFGIEYSF